MTREEAQEVGWEWYDDCPRQVFEPLCYFCGEAAFEGYLEMEQDIWCCENCMTPMEMPA
jgi:hypothetical protein